MKNLAFFLAVMFFLSSLPLTVFAASQATRDRLRELQEQIQVEDQAVREQQNLLAGTQHEMAEVNLRLQELDRELTEVFDNLQNIEFTLVHTEVAIEDAEVALEIARENSERQYEVLRLRLRAMQERGQVGWLDVLLQSTSITDFFMRLERVRAMSEFDQRVLQEFEATQAEIQELVDRLDRDRARIINLQVEEQQAQARLEEMVVERTAWLEQLQHDAEAIQEIIEVLEEEARATRYLFGIVDAQRVAEENEAARRAREAQEAQRRREAEAREAQRQASLAHLNNFNGQFSWPIPSHGTVSSPFGNRAHPITGRPEHHTGIDVAAPQGTRVIAAADGVVRFAGWGSGYGNHIIIDHGNGYSTLYAHHHRNRVSQGQSVTRGQHIADVGTTGLSTGNHLHFEILRSGVPINPMPFFR